jgi:hypothetical protein
MQRLPQRIFALTSTLEKLGIPHLQPLSSSSSPQSMPKIRSSAIAASTVKQNGPSLTTCALRKCIFGTDTENNSSMAFPATCRRCQGVLFGLCNAHVALEVVHTGARCGEVLHVSCCPPFSVALPFPSVHSTESARNRFHRRGGRVPPHDLQSVVTLMCVAERPLPLWSHCDGRACFRSWNGSLGAAPKVRSIDPAASRRDPCFGLAQNLILDILGVPYSIPQAKEACLQGIQYQYKHAMSQLGQPSTTICSSIVSSVANAVFYEACLCPWTATVVARHQQPPIAMSSSTYDFSAGLRFVMSSST